MAKCLPSQCQCQDGPVFCPAATCSSHGDRPPSATRHLLSMHCSSCVASQQYKTVSRKRVPPLQNRVSTVPLVNTIATPPLMLACGQHGCFPVTPCHSVHPSRRRRKTTTMTLWPQGPPDCYVIGSPQLEQQAPSTSTVSTKHIHLAAPSCRRQHSTLMTQPRCPAARVTSTNCVSRAHPALSTTHHTISDKTDGSDPLRPPPPYHHQRQTTIHFPYAAVGAM